MRLAPIVFGTLVVAAALVATAASGCISNNATPPAGQDSALPAEDTGVPSDDGGPATDSNRPPADSGGDTTVTPGPDSGDASDSAASTATVRFGNFTSSALATLDLCIAPHGTAAWEGPLLGGAGLATGLPQLSVSKYFSVPAGQDDVRLVPPGSSSCNVDSGVPDITSLPPIPPGVTLTVGIADPLADAGTSPRVVALVDETATGSGKAGFRLVNVASSFSDAVTLDLGSGVAAQPLFVNVTPTQVLDPGADTQGYRAVNAVASIDLTFLSAATDPFLMPAPALPTGTIATMYVAEDDVDGFSYDFVSCLDGPSNTTTGALSNCTTHSINTTIENPWFTRFANFIADPSAPAADVCIKYHALSTFAGPLLAAGDDAGTPPSLNPPASQGGSSSAVSGYFEVAAGYQYDVRYVAAGSATCATGLGADFLYTSPVLSNATVAATGFLTVPGDAGEPGMFDAGVEAGAGALSSVGLAFVAIADENSTATDAVRVINLAATNPQPFDVQAASWTYTDIAYGAYGTQPGSVDSSGYMNVASGGGGFTVSDTIGGGNEASLSFGLGGSQVETFFIFGVNGGPGTFVGTVDCTDSDVTFGGIWPCGSLGGG